MNEAIAIRSGGFGKAIRRKEDLALITGQGRFPSDFAEDGMLYGHIVRSTHAHANFSIDNIEAVRELPGVRGVWTGKDVEALGSLPSPGLNIVARQYRLDIKAPPHPLLAVDRVRFVGDAIAFIVAERHAEGLDAAEQLDITYDPLPTCVSIEEVRSGASATIHEEILSNTVYEVEVGEREHVEEAFANTDKTVLVDLVNNRIVCNYMEPRSVLASYDPKAASYCLVLGSQGPHSIRNILADLLGADPTLVRVITPPDVGGGFGTRFFAYREYALAAVAARELGLPVKWQADRTDHFLGDYHGRDHLTRAEMALNSDGKFLALRVHTTANLGAYIGQIGAFVPYFGSLMDQGAYDIPAVHINVKTVLTNTAPTDAYRGAGRPEAAFLIERLVDHAAREFALPPDEIRRKNFIRPEQFPYRTKTGRTYDVGEFEHHMTRAMELADWHGFSVRLSQSSKSRKLRGIGMASYIEACSGFSGETAKLTLDRDGHLQILIGSQATGQGHQTVFAQIAGAILSIDIQQIEVIQGDTGKIESGGGTGGSRSIPVGSVDRAASLLADRIKRLAAEHLEASEFDIELVDQVARVKGTDRSLSYTDLVRLNGSAFGESATWTPERFTYPNGTHICEVEIDPETGETDIVNYVAVDDFGVVVNPLLLDGQIHGGIAQGIGQALFEHTVYEPESGQLLTGGLMDYALPRADRLPSFSIAYENVPSAHNALGIKGAGEAGTIGATPATMNTVIDALDRAYGIRTLQMPATPNRVWQAIQVARTARASSGVPG